MFKKIENLLHKKQGTHLYQEIYTLQPINDTDISKGFGSWQQKSNYPP